MFSSRYRHIINTFRKANICELAKYKNYTKPICTAVFPIVQKPELIVSSINIRFKHKKPKKQEEFTDSDEEDAGEWTDEISDKQNKLISVKVNSLRADVIVKAGLGIARNKIETLFYESKIRVNGRKLFKKSEMLSVGDEIDVIKGPSITNPDFLTVARVEILSSTVKGEALFVKLRRNKNLIIENYTNENAWKS